MTPDQGYDDETGIFHDPLAAIRAAAPRVRRALRMRDPAAALAAVRGLDADTEAAHNWLIGAALFEAGLPEDERGRAVHNWLRAAMTGDVNPDVLWTCLEAAGVRRASLEAALDAAAGTTTEQRAADTAEIRAAFARMRDGLEPIQCAPHWLPFHDNSEASIRAAAKASHIPMSRVDNAYAAYAAAIAKPPAAAKLAEIRITADTMPAQIDQAEQAMLDSGQLIFRQGDSIVRVGWDAAGGNQEAARVSILDERGLVDVFNQAATWLRFDVRTKKHLPTGCPYEVAATYLARGPTQWRLRHLAGIVNMPTLRMDGSLIELPGYDDATGLFHDARTETWPGFYVTPDTAASVADDAIDELDALLNEFPFVELVDRAVAIAAILTAAIRPILPAAPLFAFTAPTPGTGKSYLVDLVSMIATGNPASVLSWQDDDAENRKALDARLMEGARFIALDNITVPLSGDRLNQMLTQSRIQARVLGQSKTVDVPCSAFVTANGNNLSIAADTTRRVMLCRLDAGIERPELRPFRHDPVAVVKADRGRYVAAALTVLQAYHLAGRPDQPKSLGSFGAWSAWVRGAVMWLGFSDPADSIETVRADDPTRAAHLAVMTQWNAVLGSRRVTSAQLIAEAVNAPEFREALLAVAGAAGAINSQRLGRWLGSMKGKPIGELKLEAGGAVRGVSTWALVGGRSNVVPMLPPGEDLASMA